MQKPARRPPSPVRTWTATGAWGAFAILLGAASLVGAAPPELKNVSQRGLQVGVPTTIVIDGANLDSNLQVVVGGVKPVQAVKPVSGKERAEIEVTLDKEFPPGVGWLRVITSEGISNGLPIAWDHLPQEAFKERCETTPIALSGALGGDQVLTTSFTGKKGQPVVVEVEARRLASELNPVIRLYDARKVQLAWAQGSKRLAGDARLSAVLPADGEYWVEIHDALYQGRAPGHFRLKIGDFRFVDFVLPLAVMAQETAAVEAAGTNLPAGAKFTVNPKESSGSLPVACSAEGAVLTGFPPSVQTSAVPEQIETPNGEGKLQEIAAPAGISGRIAAAGQEDRYRLNAPPGSRWRLDVQAARLGSELDGVLTVYDATGNSVLATSDDRPGTSDPGLDVAVPAGAPSVVVGIKDVAGRGGAEYVYRIGIEPVDRPDFRLTLAEDRVNVPRKGTALVRVTAERLGYQGPIQLHFDGLPAGVAVAGDTIAAGSNVALAMLSGPESQVQGSVRIWGKNVEPVAGAGIVRVAVSPATPFAERAGWLREEVALATTTPTPMELAWAPGTPSLPTGGAWETSMQVRRQEGVNGVVRLSLVTNQTMPKKTIKENNQDKIVDDVERALRLDGMPQVAAGQPETAVKVLVPADLPDGVYQLAVKGELLSDDGQRVQHTSYSPVLTASIERPLSLVLTGPNKVNAPAGKGDLGKFQGKVKRKAGFTAPVRVSLAGLPKTVPAPIVEVPADQEDFELTVGLPFGTTPGELSNLHLLATTAPNAAEGAAQRSNTVAVGINVVAGEQPAAEKPLAIFEDEQEFVSNLTQGGGEARLETGRRFSGAASLRVTPDQKFNPALPNLGIKIRKNPGPGEYRYLRFAWLKKGGQQICFQINHDGQWGPQPANPTATFRYHAGPGECFNGSLHLESPPAEQFEVVTRDLYADFGEFTFNGLGLSALDGEYALFDHIYLSRAVDDLNTLRNVLP